MNYLDPSRSPVRAGVDPASDQAILSEIMALNRHISESGESIEGGICYINGTPAAEYAVSPPVADPDHVRKRANLATMARRSRTMLEIGVNGGHSALIALMANPSLHLFCVDICMHRYTALGAQYLKTRFGRRFHFREGDSREVMPSLALEQSRLAFDLIHIDGGHTAGIAVADMSNAIRMAEPGASLIMDDINAPMLNGVVELVISLGYLTPLRDRSGLHDTVLHEMFEVTQRS